MRSISTDSNYEWKNEKISNFTSNLLEIDINGNDNMNYFVPENSNQTRRNSKKRSLKDMNLHTSLPIKS